MLAYRGVHSPPHGAPQLLELRRHGITWSCAINTGHGSAGVPASATGRFPLHHRTRARCLDSGRIGGGRARAGAPRRCLRNGRRPPGHAVNAEVRTRRATLRTEAGSHARSRPAPSRDCAERARTPCRLDPRATDRRRACAPSRPPFSNGCPSGKPAARTPDREYTSLQTWSSTGATWRRKPSRSASRASHASTRGMARPHRPKTRHR